MPKVKKNILKDFTGFQKIPNSNQSRAKIEKWLSSSHSISKKFIRQLIFVYIQFYFAKLDNSFVFSSFVKETY